MSAIPQIRSNAAWVVDNFGPQSGIDPFAYTPESIAFLDGFIERQNAIVRDSDASVSKFVSLLGAYLGETIIAAYGGEWQETPNGIGIAVRTPSHVHFLQPFHKVHKRIVNGIEDSLSVYFNDLIPTVLKMA